MKKLVPLFVVLALFGCKKQGVDESLNDKLVKSAAMGRIDEVKQYLPSYFHKGGDVKYRNDYGRTALYMAVAKNHVEIVELLLENGSDANTVDDYGLSAIMRAADNGNMPIAKMLVAKGADVNLKTPEGKTALTFATDMKNDEMVKFLKDSGAKE